MLIQSDVSFPVIISKVLSTAKFRYIEILEPAKLEYEDRNRENMGIKCTMKAFCGSVYQVCM